MARFEFLLFVAVLAGWAGLAHAGFEDGGAAYSRGDFARAYKEFGVSAERGNADTQYNLGLMYDCGTGMPQDLVPEGKSQISQATKSWNQEISIWNWIQ